MALGNELISEEEDGALRFGNYELKEKTKKDGFMYNGDSYKVKTFNEITKLEKNGNFVYESVPGTLVRDFRATKDKILFSVEGNEDAQVTLGLEPETGYKVTMNDVYLGKMKTNVGGKLSLSAELEKNESVSFQIDRE